MPSDPSLGGINRLRTAGGRASVPAEFGNITTMFACGTRLYLIAQRGVTSGVTADSIDPHRYNPHIPWIVQRTELSYGSETAFVQRTLCTAVELIKSPYIQCNINVDEALETVLRASQDFAVIADFSNELSKLEARVREQVAQQRTAPSHLPNTPNLQANGELAVLKLRSIQLCIVKLCQMFYPKQNTNDKWANNLIDAVAIRHPDDQAYLDFVTNVCDHLRELEWYRHAITHSDDKKWVRFTDYDLAPDSATIAPTVEILHPNVRISRRDIGQFLRHHIDELSAIFENTTAMLCDRNARQFSTAIRSYVREHVAGKLNSGARFTWAADVTGGSLQNLQGADLSPRIETS
jgi:hypothetical protein